MGMVVLRSYANPSLKAPSFNPNRYRFAVNFPRVAVTEYAALVILQHQLLFSLFQHVVWLKGDFATAVRQVGNEGGYRQP